MARQAERDRIADEKTAKNRAKRQKRKHRGGEPAKKEHEPDGKRSKFAGGGEVEEPKAREDREEVNTVAEVQAAQAAAASGDAAERRAEVSITVVDDE
jgi:hypothetical protein